MAATQHPLLGVIFLGRKRIGFDPAWGSRVAAEVREYLGTTCWDVLEPSEKVVDEATLRQGVAELKASGIQVLLTLQTTMSDARLARSLAQNWPGPILLWATPENPEGDMISSCSLVGIHNWATNLRHLDHPFEIIYGHPKDSSTRQQFDQAVRLAWTLHRLRGAKLVEIGGQAPGFFHMAANPTALQQTLGVQHQQFSLNQFMDVLNELPDQAVREDVEAVRALGLSHRNSSDDDLPMASRLYLAMRHFLTEERADALAVRCWPELPNLTGQWPYLGMTRLMNEGHSVAPEGDSDGALLGLIGLELGLGAGYLTDWLEHTADTVTCWHAGMMPFSLSPPIGEPGGPVLAQHFNVEKPLVVESILRPDEPVTIARLWNIDGIYCLSAAEGTSLAPSRRLMGSHGVVQLTDRSPDAWLRSLCDAGMPHHVTVFHGHCANLLESFARLAGLEWF